MNIRLKERQEGKLSELEVKTTFKIPESSFVFMKVDMDGVQVLPVSPIGENPKPTKAFIPNGKIPVVCLNSGKIQFLNSSEKVEIVELESVEVVKDKNDIMEERN